MADVAAVAVAGAGTPARRRRPGALRLAVLRPPLTALGWSALALAVGGYLAGWWLGWIELIVLAAGCATALLVAVPFVVGRMRVDVVRRLAPDRVQVGDRARAVIDVVNPRALAVRPRTLTDRLTSAAGTYDRRLRVPRLAGGATHRIEYALPTRRRGRFEVGPAVFARTDPLHLLRREVRHTGTDVLWVHPRHAALGALPVGFAKDLEGPTSDTSPLGDVAFHSLRDYEPGDDYRHIHWMSTARSADRTPLVRHYVDNRRPHLAVVLDTRPPVDAAGLASEQFEIAVEIAASVATSALLHREPATVWTTSGPVLGRAAPGTRDDLLDRLALAEQGPGQHPTAAALAALRGDRSVSAVLLVTGPAAPTELLGFVQQVRRRARVIVARVWPPGTASADPLPGARLVDVDSLDAFGVAWRGIVR